MTERATGRLVHHDPRSRAYAAPRREVRPVSWLHRLDAPVLDQGWLNGCTGFAGAAWLNSALAHGNRRRYHRAKGREDWPSVYVGAPDAEALYSAATRLDPWPFTYPPTDGGSSGLGVAKALHQLGVIDRYQWTFDFGNALAWAQRQPVLLGTLWTEAMTDPDADGVIHIGTDRQIKAAEDSGMGHEYLLRGVNWPRKLARIRNSWSAAWGFKGEAMIPLTELERLVMAYQGDVCVPEVAPA